jgi:alkylation response protein AidB-like acyl-CoA dehydrogenase
VYRQLGAIDLSLATLVFLHNTNGLRPLLDHATPALRDALVPPLAAGRSSPRSRSRSRRQAATSARSRRTATAQPDGGWSVSGVKRWNGSGWAGVVHVFARTNGRRLTGAGG